VVTVIRFALIAACLSLTAAANAQEFSTASSINNRGDIAGGSTTSGPAPFVGWVIGRKTAETIAPFGGPAALAFGANDRGDVVGQADTAMLEANGMEYISQAFLSRHGVVTNLGTLPGFNNSQAYAINNGGTIVGWSYNQSPFGPFTEPTFRAFAYDRQGPGAGVMRDLGTLGGATSVAFGINDAGAIVGRSQNAAGLQRAFLLSDGAWTDLGTLGGTQAEARAISNNGVVVGMSRTATGARRAFSYANGVMVELPSLGGPLSRAFDVNNRGEIVGQSVNTVGEMRAVLWRNGAIVDLGTLGGRYAIALSINERGDIVGESETAAGSVHAFLWRNGVMIDLGSLP
jgi:probable HAF family extracellular repeat protein